MKIKPTPETIWTRPAYLPYVQPQLTDSAIQAAEDQLGYRLPDELLKLLRVQNGGPIRFQLPNSTSDLIAGIGSGFPSLTDFNMSEHQQYVDFSLDALVPFDGDGHWYHCLDYRGNEASPCVSYIDVECNRQELLAESFSMYVQQLELVLENELVLHGVEDTNDAQEQLEAMFGGRCEEKVSNLGIPYLKLQTGKRWDECFWFSPNRVARGYTGDGGTEAIELIGEGEALHFPELPPDTVIFEAPSEHILHYKKRLTDAGLNLLDIHDAAGA